MDQNNSFYFCACLVFCNSGLVLKFLLRFYVHKSTSVYVTQVNIQILTV